MSYREKLIVENGRLSLPSVESLSREELRAWVFDRLQGRDVAVPGDVRQGERAYSLFVLIHPQLSRYARQDLDEIVTEFVRDTARNSASSWTADAADNLLMLVQNICGEDDTVRRYLVEMAESEQFFSPSPVASPDVHYRLLQSLVALHWRGPAEFWYRQVALDAGRYAGIAFNGLALIDLEQALCLLTEVPWTEALGNQIYAALLELLEKYDPEMIKGLVQKCLPKMPPAAQAALRDFLAEEGITLKPRVPNISIILAAFREEGFTDDDLQPRRLWLSDYELPLAA